MKLSTRWLLAVLLVTPAVARAQSGDPLGEPAGGGGDTGGEGGEAGNVNDDPNKPQALTIQDTDEPQVVTAKKAANRYTKKDYPIELIKRPVTLAEAQAEVALDWPFITTNSVKAMTQILRASYGVNKDLELGITYGFGLEVLDPESKFTAGKAFSFDGGYTILPGILAVRAKLPFYVDPFAMSLIVEAPIRLTVTDKIALIAGEDLFHLKIVKFPVDPANPAFNVATVQGFAVSQEASRGSFNVNFGAIYQMKANLALYAKMGFLFPNFKTNDQPVPLFFGLTWSKSNRFDLGARIGSFDLGDDIGDTFGFAVYTAYRI